MSYTMTADYYYSDLCKLQKLYQSPWNILKNFSLSCRSKKRMLKNWYEERMRYLFEHGRDCDFQVDETLSEIEAAMRALRTVETSIENLKKAGFRTGYVTLLL